MATIDLPEDDDATIYPRWSLKDNVTIDYGYFAKSSSVVDVDGDVSASASTGSTSTAPPFYLTTAINYTNGPAHMGHAYEAATSDALARFKRLEGKGPIYFVTGADEHGQKIANTASAAGHKPIDLCNKYVTGFQCLNQRILISNDDYIRTTSDRHKRTAQALWNACAHDIYLDTYSGWYNIREETFVTDSEAALSNFKDPTSGLDLKQVQEESYFFKMSTYHDQLVEHIQTNLDFIQPSHHRNLILARLTGDRLRDLSISRTTFAWGIPVPDGFADHHVMYVWVDALSNYLTGVNALDVDTDADHNLAHFWPASVHIIGKDILWFHTVIWPCLLMSAGLPLPKTVFAHGFVNDKEGKKMSKSMGNVVDPHDMLDKVPVDTFRWYLCKEAPYGGELSFSEDSMRDMHNADLCDTLGNLIHRATNLCIKYCHGIVPDVPPPARSPIELDKIVAQYQGKMNQFELECGANIAIQGFRDVNRYLTEDAPWLKKGDEHNEARQVTVRATLEAIYGLAHLLLPFLPIGGSAIFKKLNTKPTTLELLGMDCRNLVVGTKIFVGEVLYTKIVTAVNDAADASVTINKKESHAEAQMRKKEKKAAIILASKKGQDATNDVDQPEFTKMDIRVGQILKVWNHEEADKLYCEEIDLGEETGPRQIASGLREYYTLEQMQGKKVLVVCNLKASKIVGFSSNGMVLAAKGDGKVELICPPDDAQIGERVFIEGLSGEPFTSAQVKKKKTMEAVAKELKTGEGGVATWEGKVIQTTAGPCSAASLVGAPIS